MWSWFRLVQLPLRQPDGVLAFICIMHDMFDCLPQSCLVRGREFRLPVLSAVVRDHLSGALPVVILVIVITLLFITFLFITLLLVILIVIPVYLLIVMKLNVTVHYVLEGAFLLLHVRHLMLELDVFADEHIRVREDLIRCLLEALEHLRLLRLPEEAAELHAEREGGLAGEAGVELVRLHVLAVHHGAEDDAEAAARRAREL
mmetsp:Transcript_61438/g.144572  ORF Transcript_61438/g.144572 Transcript_61438/m.144572 type:complete len:203 (+) Transcript_61438:2018-2626(+)